MKTLRWFSFVLTVGLLAPDPILAQDEAGRGVARVSLLAGDISVRRGDTGEWVAAAVNGPVVVGDHVQSGSGSRAELQFDWANMLRLSADTEIRLTELERDRYQIQIAQGTATFAVLRDTRAEVELSTPSASIRPIRQGMYRISVRSGDGGLITEVSVRSGEAEIFTPQGSRRISAGTTLLIRGAVSDPEFQNVRDLASDDWDRWNLRRDQELKRSGVYNYVSRDVYGAEDLDGQGSWINVPSYGHVWSPRVAAGWAPYRNGRWSWVDYYGWNWISYDPWGWAPYHYGRWFQHANRWCWWPGGFSGYQPWRPALVGWVGWGSGFGVGVGFGGGWGWAHVGWIPLAPYERFYPWYGRGGYGRGGSIRNTTIVNNINVTNIYRNARVNNGITVTESRNFGRGNWQNVVLPNTQLERASSARGTLPMVPDAASTRWSDREVRDGARSYARTEQFYSRRTPSAVDRVPFEQQRQGVQRVVQSAFGERPAASAGSATAAPVERAAGRTAASGVVSQRERAVGEAQGGWRRVGSDAADWRRVDPGQGRSTQEGISREGAVGRSTGSWERFGEPGTVTRESRRQANDAGQVSRQDGWQRQTDPSQTERRQVERQQIDRGGWDRFGTGRGGSESIRINPPVVEDRRQRIDTGQGNGGFDRGGSQRGYPRQNDPSGGYSAPRMDRGSRGGGGFGGLSPSGGSVGAAPSSRGEIGGGSVGRSGGGGSVSRGGGGGGRRGN